MDQLVVREPSLFQSNAAEVRVGAARCPADALAAFSGITELRAGIESLRDAPGRADEEAFHKLERAFVLRNEKLILSFARPVSAHLEALMGEARAGWDPLHHFRFRAAHSREDALVFRYICVPLAYRLGYYTLAPKLAQMTFETILPDIERRVRESAARLAGRSEAEAQSLVHERFRSDAPEVSYCYSRPKTPHSIWKKAGSAAALESMTPAEFAARIDDYIGMAWVMDVGPGENRFDAVISGARRFCRDRELAQAAVRHRCHMSEGFPVMVVHALWRGIPVEVQFLGGEVLGWLAAMDYAKYKAGTTLDRIEERLPPAQWAARGRTMLRIFEESGLKVYEEGERPAFHRILLQETLGEAAEYDREETVPPAAEAYPLKPENRSFVWPAQGCSRASSEPSA